MRSTTATQELVVWFTGGKDSPPHAVRSTTATQELIVNDVQEQTPIATVEVQRRLSRVPLDLERVFVHTGSILHVAIMLWSKAFLQTSSDVHNTPRKAAPKMRRTVSTHCRVTRAKIMSFHPLSCDILPYSAVILPDTFFSRQQSTVTSD